MSSGRGEILDVLAKAFQIEVDGYTFYSMVAARSDRPAVQEIFTKLAHDEVEHKVYLLDISRKDNEEGSAAFAVARKSPDMAAFSQKVFTDAFREQALGATFEASSLSIGMTLESNAMAHFTRAAQLATDNEVRDFYRFLAAWETDHLNTLKNLHDLVRADFFEKAGFEPF